MSVTSFQDLPLAGRERRWNVDAADERVRRFVDAEDEPNERYRDMHVWYDSKQKENFGSYKLLIADVVNGRLRAIPRAIMAAAAVVDGARGGVDIPERELDSVRSHLAKYYRKMSDTPPWEKSD